MFTPLKKLLCASVPLWFIFLLSGCAKEPQNRVVLYCSVDDVYAKPIIAELEKKTGLKIDVLYDVEAAKTAGLANRIRAEKNRPRADVFWSSALLQTLLLKREGLLQKYSSPSAKDIPAAFKDKDGFWTGMGVRSRVIMYKLAPNEADTKFHNAEFLLTPRFAGKIGISNPQFGTAADWASQLAVTWGKDQTLFIFRLLKKRGVRVLPGNSVVADKIVRGELLAGVTDSDDYLTFMRTLDSSRRRKFRAVNFGENSGSGVLLPGSVAILSKAPHLQNAQKLIDAIVSRQMESLLVKQMPGVLSTRSFGGREKMNGAQEVRALFPQTNTYPDDTDKWAAAWDEIREPLAQILLSD